MRRNRAPVTRLFGALTALVTVWCLGCSAFEPLVEHLLGGGSGMMCASESGVGMSDEMRATPAGSEALPSAGPQDHVPSTVSAAQDHGGRGFSCGCQSCTSASPTTVAFVAPELAAPRAHAWRPATQLDVPREPLVPPPQSAL